MDLPGQPHGLKRKQRSSTTVPPSPKRPRRKDDDEARSSSLQPRCSPTIMVRADHQTRSLPLDQLIASSPSRLHHPNHTRRSMADSTTFSDHSNSGSDVCNVCKKKSATSYDALIKCATCPRHFHESCWRPPPITEEVIGHRRCSRCQSRGRAAPVRQEDQSALGHRYSSVSVTSEKESVGGLYSTIPETPTETPTSGDVDTHARAHEQVVTKDIAPPVLPQPSPNAKNVAAVIEQIIKARITEAPLSRSIGKDGNADLDLGGEDHIAPQTTFSRRQHPTESPELTDAPIPLTTYGSSHSISQPAKSSLPTGAEDLEDCEWPSDCREIPNTPSQPEVSQESQEVSQPGENLPPNSGSSLMSGAHAVDDLAHVRSQETGSNVPRHGCMSMPDGPADLALPQSSIPETPQISQVQEDECPGQTSPGQASQTLFSFGDPGLPHIWTRGKAVTAKHRISPVPEAKKRRIPTGRPTKGQFSLRELAGMSLVAAAGTSLSKDAIQQWVADTFPGEYIRGKGGWEQNIAVVISQNDDFERVKVPGKRAGNWRLSNEDARGTYETVLKNSGLPSSTFSSLPRNPSPPPKAAGVDGRTEINPGGTKSRSNSLLGSSRPAPDKRSIENWTREEIDAKIAEIKKRPTRKQTFGKLLASARNFRSHDIHSELCDKPRSEPLEDSDGPNKLVPVVENDELVIRKERLENK